MGYKYQGSNREANGGWHNNVTGVQGYGRSGKGMMVKSGGATSGILYLNIRDRDVLYQAFMPFMRNGGLFIRTRKQYRLGNGVLLVIKLMEEIEEIVVPGKVAWLTPKGAQNGRVAGIGVQFSAKDSGARHKIEAYLPGKLRSAEPTHTL